MKTPIHSLANLQNPIALVLLWALALLPSILHLAGHGAAVTNPLAAIVPVVAGFWFAAALPGIRMDFVWLGALLTALLWSVNWLMLAGGVCCSTVN
jgi:hypothetical protein